MNARMTGRVAVTLLAAAVMAAGCGVSKSKYLAATTSAEELTAKNQALQASLDTVSQDKAKLQEQVASMQSSVDQLNAEIEKQKAQSNEMQSTYEGLVGQLKGELSSGQVEIQQMRDGINVSLAQDILFPSGSAKLDTTGKALLTKVAEEFKSSPYQIQVIGHTDNQKIGKSLASRYPTNWELGAARSSVIVRLFQDAGLESKRLVAVSAGEARPRASNDTPEGKKLNRRIEIRLRAPEGEATASK